MRREAPCAHADHPLGGRSGRARNRQPRHARVNSSTIVHDRQEQELELELELELGAAETGVLHDVRSRRSRQTDRARMGGRRWVAGVGWPALDGRAGVRAGADLTGTSSRGERSGRGPRRRAANRLATDTS
ncbi:MAG: hypothetical protein ACRDHP_04885 [Ktedonobacterales bacterium]